MIYTFENKQVIKSDLKTVWSYFANPETINKLTPTEMRFKTLTKNLPKEIYKGLKIKYSISPIFNFPMKWKTEITSVNEYKSFTDIQLKGPYKKWTHIHTFKEIEDGILMADHISYELPLGLLGIIVHKFLVKKKIENLFIFRTKKINKEFINE